MAAPAKIRTKDIVDSSYPLLEANRAAIQSVERRTHTYGLEGVHNLDVYYPSSPVDKGGDKSPTLVFFYGGGFTKGRRIGQSPPEDLVHANLGAFFASRGILTVVADYRLVPSVVFPQGSEDVRDALLWVKNNLNEGDTDRIFILAHSAGGVHVSSLLFNPALFSPPISAAVKGVFLLSVPLEIGNGKMVEFWNASLTYYGSPKKIAANQPIALLRRASGDYVADLPPLHLTIAGSEPRMIASGNRTFAELFRKKGGVVEESVLDGHDHLSPILALSSGNGEQWGEDVSRWILESSLPDSSASKAHVVQAP